MDPNEPTPLSDQEKIRLKRIAKLQQQAPSPSSSPAPVPAPKPTPPPAPKPAPAPKQPVASTSSASPAPAPRGINIVPAGTTPRFAESFEAWQDAVVGRILNVTLDRDAAEASGWSVTYLKEVADEIRTEEPSLPTPLKLNSEWTDRLLLARLSLSPANMTDDPELITVVASLPADLTAFEYLGGAWKRERAERYKLSLKKNADATEYHKRLEALNQIKALLVSYIGLVLTDPSMFPQDHISNKTLGPMELEPLLITSTPLPPSSALSSTDLPSLLQDLAARFSPSAANDFEGGLEDIVGPLINALGMRLVTNRIDIGGGGQGGTGWREIVGAVQSLLEVKGVAVMAPEVKNWDVSTNPRATAPALELASLLGPFLRLTTFPDTFPEIAKAYLPDPTAMGRGNVESASASLRGTLGGLQAILFQMLNNVVRAGPKPREAVLSYFGNVLKANSKRAAMRVDPNTVSSEGFIINLHSILLSFAQPFMDAQFSKIDKIDPLFYKVSQRINIAEETKMSATQTESDEYYARPADAPAPPAPNFISEIFFLCCSYLHIGIMHTIKEHKGYRQSIRHEERQIADIEADSTWRGTPGEAAAQAQLDRLKARKEKWNSHVHAIEVQLLDPEYLTRCVGFVNLVMAWLVRMVDPNKQHPQTRVSLPMPEETPEVFRFLPEYLIEDITEFLSFTSKYAPQVLADNSQDELITFMLVFLSTPYMKNPYLKGQFVEIMYYLSQPMPRNPRGCLGDVLNFHPLALKNLMPSLVHAYVQIEITGSHTQFYDKFNIRYYITQIFKMVWSNPSHREALRLESLHLDRYVRFVNLLMNDTTYLLDDALMHLGKISEIQRAMDDKAAWESRPATERQEQEKLLRDHEGGARSDLDFGTESLRLLKRFAGETKEPFLTREIVDRLAAMLDMNLVMLAGPRCQDLKVRDMEKYKFRPKELLSDVLGIFLELAPRVEFQEAVAKDGRSYSRDLFERVQRIARKTSIRTDDELEGIKVLVEKVEAIKAAEEEDDAMGEVPDEFLDPLTYDIMRDPVLLPSSKTIIDRSTIKQHYLSDATDPFNRVPLKWEDITDAVEIKAQIDAFLAERKAKRTGGAAAVAAAEAAGDDAMKVDE
ncbi:ubiquitin elongating factor core-domain-containing protein [Leucosporidium creatinivorum]|uniref:RING-type E3 ubiquitin transferase n=1 Tax=Leucosporidium creatinivorum TaxID=106004 RepID=A0A1Y2FY82_9BASI|nr:ubiquitin elongating factor core-domain-containing protein [Leucosporidium creatinivorum]